MENASPVDKKALTYRLVINEAFGVIITIAITIIASIILYFIIPKAVILLTVALFIVIALVQFVILYVMSLMQYKNLKYTIGQNAISFQRGTFSIERETIPFEKIKNSTFDQTFIQRLFSVGDITIDQDDGQYSWENIDVNTATLISNAVSAKGDVQPITVATANAMITPPNPSTPQNPSQTTPQ